MFDTDNQSLNITGSRAGSDYFVRIRSKNDVGLGQSIATNPQSISPGDVPGIPQSPLIRPYNETAILISYEQTAPKNGADIYEFVLEIDTLPSFPKPHVIVQKRKSNIQRIITSAHSLPWNPLSTFTLSLGNFRGNFIKLIDSSTFVQVQKMVILRGEFLVISVYHVQ